MPDHRLECFSMRRDAAVFDGRDDDDAVAGFFGVAAVAADDAEHAQAAFLRQRDR